MVFGIIRSDDAGRSQARIWTGKTLRHFTMKLKSSPGKGQDGVDALASASNEIIPPNSVLGHEPCADGLDHSPLAHGFLDATGNTALLSRGEDLSRSLLPPRTHAKSRVSIARKSRHRHSNPATSIAR